MKKKTVLETIQIEAINALNLECDGATRIIHYRLKKEGIEHDVFVGEVKHFDKVVKPHYWIVLGDKRIVDYKLRMWLDDDAPHGVFRKENIMYKNYKYKGKRTTLNVSENLYNILCNQKF